MVAQQSPALLINKRWIRLPIFSRPDEDGVVIDFNNLFPWDELIWPAHTVLDINPDCVRKRLYQVKNQVGDLPDFPAVFFSTNPPFEQLGEIEEPVLLRRKHVRPSGCRTG